MKTIDKVGAQGDLFFVRVNDLPHGVSESAHTGERIVLAHSETGHHHSVRADGVVMFAGPENALVCYLRVDGEHADVEHARTVNPHQTIVLTRGLWQVRRQREYVPGGFRRVED